MGTQAAMIMDTVTAMKRVLAQQEDSSDSDEPYLRPPNRGNKLKRKAQYTLDGRPVKKKGRATYTKNIEYAGYHRDILRSNPKRYDEDGDELDLEDEDEEADARAAEDNPYAEIRLENLLAPLTAAANLPSHPSLSAPYLSSTLSTMAQHACDTIHRERKTLCNAKLLLRKLRGDEVWIPTEVLNASDDKEIFDTAKVFNQIIAETPLSRLNGTVTAAGSINGDTGSRTVSGSTNGEGINSVEAIAIQENNPVREAAQNLAPEESDADDSAGQAMEGIPKVEVAGMTDKIDPQEAGNLSEATGAEKDPDDETVDVIGPVVTNHQHQSLANGNQSTPEPAQVVEHIKKVPNTDGESTGKIQAESVSDKTGEPGTDPTQERPNGSSHASEPMDEDEESKQAPEPRRMRTRAQAAATSEHAASSHTASPDPPDVPPPIHPLFLLPASAKPNADYGLPAPEAEDTRRMLMVYVQKQEEVCRSAEKLYQNLLRADRERMTVLGWCKAEGHVGEMSDGEDWCDKEEWGLDEDLRKGEGDDKEGDEGTVGKKTRGRRA